ncbi:hypothetical protein MMC10_010131 [Thelotrema lepadinum]|nr:hypothetical protein [Thelotrema lepadinum]
MPPTIRDKIKDLELICPLLIGVRQQPAAALLKSPCGYLIGILPRSSRLERDRLSSNDSGLPLYVPGLCRVVEPKRLPEILMLTKAIEVISCHIVFEVKKAGGHKYLGHGVEIVPDIFDEMEGEKVHW